MTTEITKISSVIELLDKKEVWQWLLTSECIITKVKSAKPAMPMGGGMPGMM